MAGGHLKFTAGYIISGEDKNKSTSTTNIVNGNNTTKTVSVNAENFPPKSKSDNDNIVVQQGSDAKGN